VTENEMLTKIAGLEAALAKRKEQLNNALDDAVNIHANLVLTQTHNNELLQTNRNLMEELARLDLDRNKGTVIPFIDTAAGT
jgi:ABC-type phosphate transport system auxiliary subunit